MNYKKNRLNVLLLPALLLFSNAVFAAPPVVKTVPWVATNPLIPHDTWSGKAITLKGTADVSGANIQYSWDFGDSTPPATGTVGNANNIGVTHTYTGPAGTIFTARLTVTNNSTAESDNKIYLVQIQDKTLEAEINVAIDEGLWYLHKTMRRITVSGQAAGDWQSGGSASSSYYGITPTNVTAFLVNGHLETGPDSNPYKETVQRGLKGVFNSLIATNIPNSKTNPLGTFNPDTNGNNLGITVLGNQVPFYQGGMYIDAIVATGTPTAIATTGPANIVGRTYGEIVQDIVDYYSYCQYDRAPHGGGWRYSCNQAPDNSAAQWGAIGLIAAEHHFGATVPMAVKEWNKYWVDYSQDASGRGGYAGPGDYTWGPYATTPSAMVQMAMDGVGRGSTCSGPAGTAYPCWDTAETFIRNNFGNTGSAYSAIKSYYYGLFSFTKSMLLHDSNGDGNPEPITLLQSSTPGVPPLDWYAAEVSKGAPTDGVARTLVNAQNNAGYWYGHNYSSAQYPFETSWAIVMLNRTVFASGVPVAVAQAIPNPAVVSQNIVLDGSASFSQDSSKTIVSWEWDLDNDGQYDDATGPTASISFPALGNYPIHLLVTDNSTPQPQQDNTTVIVQVSIPPLAPTANANGPYVFCPSTKPWFMDGSASVNPDEGQHEPGQYPGDTIQSYAWDLNGDGLFNNAFGVQPDVTTFLEGMGVGDHLVQLKVTDTTASSYPSSTLGDLSSTASTQVSVKVGTDPACACIADLAARPKSGKVQLTWTNSGANHYNVYRSATNGGPYGLIASTTSSYSTYLDSSVVNGTTYYYVVRPAALNGNESCQSNQASATPSARAR